MSEQPAPISHDSPRLRRLRSDHAALVRLRAESTFFEFEAAGEPPHRYLVRFRGRGLARSRLTGAIKAVKVHEVEIKLANSYPRTVPELRWLTPIHHPNISDIGMVCLGGFSQHWVPSLTLDELCVMLWDMIRYHNYDVRSPYNREAAVWAATQTDIRFPVDPRPLRDARIAAGRLEIPDNRAAAPASAPAPAPPPTPPDMIFLD